MLTIPVIDISGVGNGDEENVAAQVDAACHDIGFMYVVGHGISTETIYNIRENVIRYFEQPLSTKMADRISRENYRGYIPAGFFSPNTGGGDSDNYEGYKLHYETSSKDPICARCDLYGPNKWPSSVPELKSAATEYWQACDTVADSLLRLLADIMKVGRDEFLAHFEQPLTNMTLLHYPGQQADASRDGIHAHKDTDALTILMPDEIGGLQVKARDSDDWIEIAARDDALVVNIGDLLELWSGGYFVSTPHKVVSTGDSERYSFPYFVVPRYDTVVAPFNDSQPGFERGSVHVGDVSREVWRTNWPDTESTRPEFDLGTL